LSVAKKILLYLGAIVVLGFMFFLGRCGQGSYSQQIDYLKSQVDGLGRINGELESRIVTTRAIAGRLRESQHRIELVNLELRGSNKRLRTIVEGLEATDTDIGRLLEEIERLVLGGPD